LQWPLQQLNTDSLSRKRTGTIMSKNIFLFIMFQLSICGWSSDKTSLNQKDIFSIYLVKNSNLTYATKKPELKDFVLENTPLLTVDSIASYNWHSRADVFRFVHVVRREENRCPKFIMKLQQVIPDALFRNWVKTRWWVRQEIEYVDDGASFARSPVS
jgi:hypothetical protein